MDEKMRPIEDKINHKLSACHEKYDNIQQSLKTLFEYIEIKKQEDQAAKPK